MTPFLRLAQDEQREALLVAVAASARPAHLLWKDVWVVWTLDHLFTSRFADDLVFKGGTSLSKAHGAIARFSEDVDVTYDIRKLLGVDSEIPPNASQANKLTKSVKKSLPAWVAEEVFPDLESAFQSASRGSGAAKIDGTNIELHFPKLQGVDSTGYVSPRVLIEFGARSSGEPAESHSIQCDAAAHVPTVEFPTAEPRVMALSRTFWEKATAIHVYYLKGELRGGKGFARHWYDLAQLWRREDGEDLAAPDEVARAVAEHKSRFFREKTREGIWVDYVGAVHGALRLVPEDGEDLEALRADFTAMVEDGMFIGTPPVLDEVLEACREIEAHVQKAAS